MCVVLNSSKENKILKLLLKTKLNYWEKNILYSIRAYLWINEWQLSIRNALSMIDSFP